VDAFEPVRILAPHEHDGHRDHEAGYRIARAVTERANSRIELLEYAIWLWNNWPWTPLALPSRPSPPEIKRTMRAWKASRDSWKRGDVAGLDHAVDIQTIAWRKRAALESYRSQMPSLSGEGRGRFLRWFNTSHELFRASPESVG
jgi:LmbE family N-acetylglucosaminyl deacetylase